MRSIRMAIPAAVSALALFAAVPAFAEHSWADYHWGRTSNPFPLVVNTSVTGGWVARTSVVANDWTTTPGTPDINGVTKTAPFTLELRSAATDNGTRKRCPAVSGQLRVCNASYGKNGWLGLATVWINADHHIVQGTEKLNDTYFNGYASYNNEAERRHVLCQEIGHTFGLGHQDESGTSLDTCMDYYHNINDADTQSTTPNAHDIDQLNNIYDHNDPSSTSTTFQATAKGRSNAYVSQDGEYTVITFIIWAD